MTDPTTDPTESTDPTPEGETTLEPAPETTPETTPTEPEPLPERSLIVQMQFDAGDGSAPTVYARPFDHPYSLTAEQYAKIVAETVERTVLFHVDALPILTKQEVSA